MELAFGIILLILAVFLVIAVLLQQGKNAGLGAMAGGNESYYGQGKTMTKDKILSRLTTIVAIVFCLVVVLLFMLQGKADTTPSTNNNAANNSKPSVQTSINVTGTEAATEPATAGTQATTEAAK